MLYTQFFSFIKICRFLIRTINWSISESAREMFVSIASKDITIKVEQAGTHGCRHFYNTRVSRSCKCHKKFSRIAMRKSTDVSFCVGRTCQSTSSSVHYHLRISKHDIEHETFCNVESSCKILNSNSSWYILDQVELPIKKYQRIKLNSGLWRRKSLIKYSLIKSLII